MLNHDYVAQSLRRPLPMKDGGALRTVADVANYIVALPEERRQTHWDRTVQLLLDMGLFRDQPPARTRVVLRSAAQPQKTYPNIAVTAGGASFETP